jgi:hypothetical protein
VRRGPGRAQRVARALLLLAWLPAAGPGTLQVLDEFENLSGWAATASDGARVTIAPDAGRQGRGMRIDFELESRQSFVILRRELPLTLPPNYAFTFHARGTAPRHTLEFKLIGPNSGSVWWAKRGDHTLPADWAPITIRRSRLHRAWGVTSPLERISALEIAITGSAGGSGTLWIDDLVFEEREQTVASHEFQPRVTASSSAPAHPPEYMLDHDAETQWKSGPGEAQWLEIDLGANREYGGLVLDWDRREYAREYRVLVSTDGETWQQGASQPAGRGGREYVRIDDGESRFLRIELLRARRFERYGIVELTVKPEEYFATPEPILRALAKQSRPGWLPKYWYDRQTYWTVVGVPGDRHEALLNEEGMLEVDQGSFSIEPLLVVGDQLLSWNDVHREQILEEGYLPIPAVAWHHPSVRLQVQAFASGTPGTSALYARYRVEARGQREQRMKLVLALRPFQVLPPWQSLNVRGGAAPIRELRREGTEIRVNGEQRVRPLRAPDLVAGIRLDQFPEPRALLDGALRPIERLDSSEGFACGLLVYELELSPGESFSVDLQVPWNPGSPDPLGGSASDRGPGPFVERELEATRALWRELLGRVELSLPARADALVRTLRSQIAYALIHQDGPALQPGSRTYARSWIRDGMSISLALLSMGIREPVREYLTWYAQYQGPDGKIPCCVDARGPDPTLEHDSAGQFVIAVAEYYRFTRDREFLREMWPRVVRALDYLTALRAKRTTDDYRSEDKRAFYGLLPESISHEGYSSQPVHSYWDDFFALGAFAEAAALSEEAGDPERAVALRALRESFQADLVASVRAAMERHRIDYVPGSVELGDLDPTSTAIAVLYAEEVVPALEPELRRAFERYWEEWTKRRAGQIDWEAYTPYEVRNLAALLAIGEPERAARVLSFLLADQRPPAWNQWTEIAWRDASAPNFIGDMPHGWIGSTFVNVVRRMLAMERRSDGALVLAGGVLPEWLEDPEGIAVRRLPTAYGALDYSLRRIDPGRLLLRVGGDLELPPGGIVFSSPLPVPLRGVTVNGKPSTTFTERSATLRELPAEVQIEY